MSVEVKTTMRFWALEVPEFARLMVGLEEDADDPRLPIDQLEPQVLDALAATWLDNLFASANRRSPFAQSKVSDHA